MWVRLLLCTSVGWAALGSCASAASWSAEPTPLPRGASASVLSGVSCTAGSDCTAVGHFNNRAGAGAPLAERWDGTRWSIEPTAKPAGARASLLFEVSCPSRAACVAVGSMTGRTGATVPLAERSSRGRWSMLRTSPPAGNAVSYLAGVSCASARNCVAVGYAGNAAGTAGAPLAERWNGRSWVPQRPPRPTGATVAFLSGISCTSPTACVAVGFSVGGDRIGRPLAERWDGRHWAIERTPSPRAATEVQLAGVSCVARGPCVAAGFFGIVTGIEVMLAEQRSAARWTIQRTLYPAGARGVQFAGVSCPASASCAAVGSFENEAGLDDALVERWDGTGWRIQAVPVPDGTVSNSLAGVSCSAARECTAVGSSFDSNGAELPLAERYS